VTVVRLICFSLLCVNLSFMVIALTSSKWKRLSCRVELSVVSVPNVQMNQRFPALKANYKYTVGGRAYSGWRIAYCQAGIAGFERSLPDDVIQRLQPGETVFVDAPIFYCPLVTGLSVLHTGLSHFGLLEYMLRNALLCAGIYWSLRG
jgi:hypothetical protein